MKFTLNIIFLSLLILTSLNSNFAQNNPLANQVRLAKSFESKGNFEEAEKIYAKIYEQQPKNYQFYNFYYNVLLNQKKYNEAINLINNQLKISPSNINLHGDLGTVYFKLGKEEEANKAWNNALTINPNNAFAYRTIANYLIDNRIIERAIEVLGKGNSVAEDNTIFSYDIANLYSITMKYEEATKEYCKILAQKPKQLSIVKNKILGYINANQAGELTLRTVEEIYDENNEIYYLQLLAELYSRTGKDKKAFNTIIKIEKETTNNGSSLFSFAQKETRFSNFNSAANAFKYIIDNYPGSALFSESEIGYTRSLEEELNNNSESINNWKPLNIDPPSNLNDYKNLTKAYSNLVNKYPENKIGWEAEFRMAKIYSEKLNLYEKADSIFKKIIREVKTILYVDKSRFELAKIAIYNGELSESQNFLEKIIKSRMAKPHLLNSANYLLAKTKMWKGHFSEAIQIFNRVIEDPKEENTNDALQYSLLLNTFKNDSTNLFLFFNADYLLERRKFIEAAGEFKKLADNKNLFLLKDFASLRYAQLLIALNNYEQSRIFLEESGNCDKANIYQDRFLYLLGIIYYYGLNEQDKALKPLTKILDEFPNSIYFNKARKIVGEISLGAGKSI